MKKLFVVTGLITVTLFTSCRATVRTPKTSTDIKVGSIDRSHLAQTAKSVKI